MIAILRSCYMSESSNCDFLNDSDALTSSLRPSFTDLGKNAFISDYSESNFFQNQTTTIGLLGTTKGY
jgi:hypothetical protein